MAINPPGSKAARIRRLAEEKRQMDAAQIEAADAKDLSGKSKWERFYAGFDRDFGVGGEDMRKVGYRIRDLQNRQAEAPKMGTMILSWLTGQRAKDFAGISNKEGQRARAEMGLELSKDPVVRTGQAAGTIAGDLTQDSSRRFYWLLNALQATGEVINETAQSVAQPRLYGKTSTGVNIKGRIDPKTGKYVEDKEGVGKREAIRKGYMRLTEPKDPQSPAVANRGYSVSSKGEVMERNFEPGWVQSLSWPTGIAINTGLGLMTPFGGAEGYKAAIPSEEDPTKTANVLGEVGLKYIMGRTGQLLPYDEFKKVRPDVSRGEYNAYKAFKYDKAEDWDPSDGDLTLGAGAVKLTSEGIHGPELQFLGRSLPVTTGALPFGSAVIGGSLGVMHPRSIRGGWIGGMAGLAAGQITGNLLEQERRRRNAAANELYAPSTVVG